MWVKLVIIIIGIILIFLVNWYFFFSERSEVKIEAEETGIQEVKITIKGGYDPDVIVVKKGIPVRLNFYRDETAECSEEVQFGDFGIRKKLQAFQTTSLEFTPEKEGEYVFTCGMGMLRGKMIVR